MKESYETLLNIAEMMAELDRNENPECGMTRIRGCRLTRSDCDMIRFVAAQIENNGGFYPSYLMNQYGEAKKLFMEFGVPFEKEGWF